MTALSTSSWNFISHERDVRWKTVGDSHRFFLITLQRFLYFSFINNCNSPISITVAFGVTFHNYREVTVRCNHNHEDIAHRKLIKLLQMFTLFLWLEKDNRGWNNSTKPEEPSRNTYFLHRDNNSVFHVFLFLFYGSPFPKHKQGFIYTYKKSSQWHLL